jgi:hypothetical protein
MKEAKKFKVLLLSLSLAVIPTSFLAPQPAFAANAMIIDGIPVGTQTSPGAVTSGSISTTMTTTRSNDILIAYVGWESGGHSSANSQSSSVTSATGTPALTWNLRTRYQNGGDQTQEIWWAVAPTAGNYGVQVNWSSQYVDDADLILFAINGANLTTPWEGTSATKLPLGAISGSYSTTYANTFVLTFYANEKSTNASGPIPNGVNTSIANVINNGQTWGWSTTTGTANTVSAVIIDALRDANYIDITTATISISANVTYKSPTTIQATIPSSSGKVTFYAMGKPIAGCKNIKVNGTNSVSCSWKPALHGSVDVFVNYLSDGGQQIRSALKNIVVTRRNTLR